MWRPPIGLVALVAAVFLPARLSLAGIDDAYVKPADKKSWGELLVDFVGHRGFGRSYALIVGISDFDHFSSLPTANDPLRMRDFLLHEAGFDYVHVLTDEKATKARIEELMVDVLPGMIHENDQFLFYWSGHGTQRPNAFGGQLGYLPLANSPKDRYGTMISMGDILRWDEVLAARQALFLLDACFSGLAGSVSQSGHRELQIDQLDKPAHHLVSAGTGEEQTIAGDRWGGSIFADAVLRAMRGEADAETSYPRDGVVSLSELIGYIKTRVAVEASAAHWTKSITPQLRDLRTNAGEFLFLTSERKLAKLKDAGVQYQGRFEHGTPVAVMGDAPPPACDREADRLFWDAIKNEAASSYFEVYLKGVESGELCGLFADIARLKGLSPTPGLQEVPEGDAVAVERNLALSRDDRRLVQMALNDLGQDAGPEDGLIGPRTRSALAAWQRSKGYPDTGFLDEEQTAFLVEHAQGLTVRLQAERPIEPAVGKLPDTGNAGDAFRDCAACPEMVVVPAGEFVMGSPLEEAGRDSEEGPQHRVAISEPFAVGRYELTFDEWDDCVKSGGCRGYEVDDEGFGRDRRPVMNVSWDDAKAYVAWLSKETGHPYRLLSEAEWEYTARAGTTTSFWWGDKITPDNANYGQNVDETAEAGSYPANPWGFHDMHGNVAEWVEDCWNDDYEGAPADGSARVSGECNLRVARGGSWYDEPWYVRSAVRNGWDAVNRDDGVGIRVARTLRRRARLILLSHRIRAGAGRCWP